MLTPPVGASARQFIVEWRALIGALPNHFAQFVIQRDIAGATGTRPQIVRAARGLRRSIRRTIGLVTAFTVGHCLTLIGVTVANWSFPAQPIDVIIAISVFVSAAHAARPMFPAYEPVVAAGFGLVHGLAFATLVRGLSPGGDLTPVALIGFNLGIEMVQVAIVVVILPALIGLARYPHYRFLRLGVAIAGMAAACAWFFDRAFGLGGDAAVLADLLIAGVSVALILVSAISTAVFVLQRSHISLLRSA